MSSANSRSGRNSQCRPPRYRFASCPRMIVSSPISLHVEKRAQSGGRSRANGSQSYRSRMLELEMSGEFVEIVSSGSRSIEGTISVVGTDHVVLIDRNDTEWFIPLSTIAITLQRQ